MGGNSILHEHSPQLRFRPAPSALLTAMHRRFQTAAHAVVGSESGERVMLADANLEHHAERWGHEAGTSAGSRLRRFPCRLIRLSVGNYPPNATLRMLHVSNPSGDEMYVTMEDRLTRCRARIAADVESADCGIFIPKPADNVGLQCVERVDLGLPECRLIRDMPPRYEQGMSGRHREGVANGDDQFILGNDPFGR